MPISPELQWIVLIALIIILFWAFQLRHKIKDQELKFKDYELKIKDFELNAEKKLNDKLEIYKSNELLKESEKIKIETKRESLLALEEWKRENELAIRQDAINRSGATTLGKVTEHLIPYMKGVFPYNPKEARFIGSPIDLIVFNGIEGEENDVSIHFIEVKIMTSTLSTRQRKIRDAIINKRVEWRELRI